MTNRIVLLATIFASTLAAQAPAPPPTFDATDVRPIANDALTSTFRRGGMLRGNRYELRNATMIDLISVAYAMDAQRITDGPSWLEFNRFDIAGLAPAGTPPERLRLMLQALLADRFKLVVRNATRPMQGYALKRGPGSPALVPASNGPSDCQASSQKDANGVFTTITCRNTTMSAFADALPRLAEPSISPPIVVDMTELKGAFDFTVKWTPAMRVGDAIATQLGLTLEPQEVSAAVLQVESANLQPSANAPDLAAKMPPLPPPAFEVAAVRPSPPDAATQLRMRPNGQVDVSGVPLRLLIAMGWGLPNPPDGFIEGPAWLESRRFDITARAFADTGGNPDVDQDVVRQMIRTLVAERFQMKARFETRPVNALALTAGKPKLTKADPSRRTRCANVTTARSNNPNLLSQARVIACQNMTMEEFAALLPNLAADVRTQVADLTGIQGRWDFTLTFSPLSAMQRGAGSGAAGVAADPTGMQSVFESVDRDLGLKLDRRSRPAQVLVIDSISETPTND